MFTRLFEQAEPPRFSPTEQRGYREGQKDFWDFFRRQGDGGKERTCQRSGKRPDNDTEFYEHEYITRRLGVQVYFANPYYSWEKGCIENINIFYRQYLPRSPSFVQWSDHDILELQHNHNRRPRKKALSCHIRYFSIFAFISWFWSGIYPLYKFLRKAFPYQIKLVYLQVQNEENCVCK